MPIFEYKCKVCDKDVDVLVLPGQELEGHRPDQCPHCGYWASLQRKVSSFGFELKGEGWPGKDGHA
jgi:putative FmdB family regulatory protein